MIVSDKPEFLLVPKWVHDMLRQQIDPWQRELDRARKQLSEVRNQPKG